MKQKFLRLRSKFKNFVQTVQENFNKSKETPRSKIKSLFLGFTTVLGIFGITLLTPVLTALAKDIQTFKRIDRIHQSPVRLLFVLLRNQVKKLLMVG